jgi:translation initiation factor 2B subunit (eIF-2B alpha/beta/delta family)
MAGTGSIARGASALQIPVYAPCSSDKFLPRTCGQTPDFDLTPLRYLAGIVTEDGIASPEETR